MLYIIEHEGLLSLFKGVVPQVVKGVLVQGLLMMSKERYVTHVLVGLTKTLYNKRTGLSSFLYFSLLPSGSSGVRSYKR